jgi:TonB family protein
METRDQGRKKEPRRATKKAPHPVQRKLPVKSRPVVKKPKTISPKPAPALPAPKVLAAAPTERFADLTTDVTALVQLPTRHTSVPVAELDVEASRVTALDVTSEDEFKLPKELLEGGEGRVSRMRTPSALLSPDFGPYLKKIKERVMAGWHRPAGSALVDLIIVLDRTGNLVSVEVAGSTNSRLDDSALEATRRASPFPPIPESLKDLAGAPLRLRFKINQAVR